MRMRPLVKVQKLMFCGIFCLFQDAEDFQEAYDILIEYVKNKDNWPEMEEELRFRGVGIKLFTKILTLMMLVANFVNTK